MQVINSDNGFCPLLSETGLNQSIPVSNQLKLQVMYSDWDSSSPGFVNHVQNLGGPSPVRQCCREGREFKAFETLWGS